MKDWNRVIFILLFLIALLAQGSAQTVVQFVLKDSVTLEPISDAFIFVEGSSIGTSSDLKGRAQLTLDPYQSFSVVVTHVQYENLALEINQPQEDLDILLSLKPIALDLEQVIVQSKQRGKGKRKSWMRRFSAELFGPTARLRDIELINPESIWFEETDSLLEAHAIDNLVIENKYLAYTLRLSLEHFSIDHNNDVRYRGQLHFTDSRDQNKRSKRIDRRRKEIYLESPRLFFQSLVHDLPINSDRFRIGTTRLEDEIYVFDAMKPQDLVWNNGSISDTLRIDDHLTVINKGRTVRLHNKRKAVSTVVQSGPPTSFLKSRSGKFIISKRGDIANKKDIEESGYWTNFRLSAALPWDYEGAIQFGDYGNRPPVLDSLAVYRHFQINDKVYLHLSQESFSNRDRMYFQGHLLDAYEHRPSSKSKILYVDLISPTNDVIKTWELHVDKALSGFYQWDGSQTAGTYRLRAYTNTMRNAPQGFYHQNFEVYDFLVSEPSDTSDSSDHGLVVDVFPEGGKLLQGIPNDLTIWVRDSTGTGVYVEGIIVDEMDAVVSKVKTSEYGLGLTSFVPRMGKKYFLQIPAETGIDRFSLPDLQRRGANLSASVIDDEVIYLDISTTDSVATSDLNLVGHARGTLFLQEEDLKAGQQFKLKKASIPSGVIQFTLFDAQHNVLSERLVFNDTEINEKPITIEPSSENFIPHDLVQVNLRLDSTWLDDSVCLSARIINRDLVSPSISRNSMASEILLVQDLPVTIEGVDDLLMEMTAKKRFLLDLIMQTQTWFRFDWNELVSRPARYQKYPVEKGFKISGFTTEKNDSSRLKTSVMLNNLDANFFYDRQVTDELGAFEFTDLPFLDTTNFTIQARKYRKGLPENTDREGDRLVDIHLKPRSRAPVSSAPRTFRRAIGERVIEQTQLDALREKSLVDDTLVRPAWTIDLEGVEVVAKRAFTSNRPTRGQGNVFFLDAIDWVKPETGGTHLLNRLMPRFNFYLGGGKLMATFPDWQGERSSVPVTIVIDGIGAEPGGSNVGPFLGLRADDIESMYIGRTFINITTRNIPRSREMYLESGILQYVHPGFHKAEPFQVVDRYGREGRDLRKVVQWIPEFTFDQGGKAALNFTTVGQPADYELILEGVSTSGRLISQRFNINLVR